MSETSLYLNFVELKYRILKQNTTNFMKETYKSILN